MDRIGAMLDRSDERNRHTEVGAVPSKIISILAHIFSIAVRLRSFTEVTPIARNGRGLLRAAVYANN